MLGTYVRARIDHESRERLKEIARAEDLEESSKHSIFGPVALGRTCQRGNEIPYEFNVYNRDYLLRAVEHVIAEKKPSTIPRIYTLLKTKLVRKIFSIMFFAFIATIQKKEYLFETLCLFFFKKFLKFFMNINPPKEEVMDILPFVIGKAILLAF